jgi:hypothetical protein
VHSDVDQAGVVDESLHVSRAVHPVDTKVLDWRRCVFGYATAKFHDAANIIRLSWWFAHEINMI